jgi:hypothetical protein
VVKVTGLPPATTSQALAAAFSICGVVQKAHAVGHLGLGIVTFDAPAAVQTAVLLNGTLLVVGTEVVLVSVELAPKKAKPKKRQAGARKLVHSSSKRQKPTAV